MTVVRDVHEEYGARFTDVAARALPADFGRPARTHRAVRNGVGVTEQDYGVLVLTGEDRREFVDNAVSNRVPATDGEGVYALLLDHRGRIRTDMYVYVAPERLLVFTPPGEARPLAEDWRETVFVQDVEIEVATGEFGVFGVHGPKATEKVASVLTGEAPPEARLTFVRGAIRDEGVTVVRGDDLAGEESYDVIVAADVAPDVYDALLTRGFNAIPFGRDVWNALTLEAGTPVYPTDLADALPNDCGLANAVDYEKGCFVGQEVVSRVHNQGEPSRRLVGLRLGPTDALDTLPAAGAPVSHDGDEVGTLTRVAESPLLESVVALAFVTSVHADATEYAVAPDDATGDPDADGLTASRVALPFVEGGERSARLPTY